MAKTKKPEFKTLENVQQLLNFDGSETHLKLNNEDLGGELLPILSKGLYTNPLDCIREYVQNGVDAATSEIEISITGNSITITDFGVGMDMSKLTEARKFGVSNKDLAESIGFRGIGIYSGFDLCEKLVIQTKVKGKHDLNIMVLDFASMKRKLEEARSNEPRTSISLTQLITENSTFLKEEFDNVDSSFTQVQLENISENHIFTLRNREKLKQYLLQTLPVDFDEKFKYRDIINKHLEENVPNFKAIKVTLHTDDAEDETVAKPNICSLQNPVFNFIKTSDKNIVGYYWACLSEKGRKIDNQNNSCFDQDSSIELDKYSGFQYKKMGFTIGDRSKLKQHFKAGSGTLYHWYIGEIYVLDAKVVPNAERDDFENSPAKEAFDLAIQDTLIELDKKAHTFQERRSAENGINTAISEFEFIEKNLNKTLDPIDASSKLDDVIKKAKKHKSKAATKIKDKAQELILNAEKLKGIIRTDVERKSHQSEETHTTDEKPVKSTTPKPSSQSFNTPAPPPVEKKNLIDIFTEFDINSNNSYKFVNVINEILTEMLDNQTLQPILEQIETKLSDELE